MDDPQIIPAILAETETEYKQTLDKLEESGLFSGGWVHIDFTPTSVSPQIVNKYPTSLKREAHIMVDGLRVEGMDRVIKNVVNPQDDLPDLEGVDFLLIMGVYPGSQGQQLLPGTIEKIKKAARLRQENNLSFYIEVDGGVLADNIQQLITSGADGLVIGSHLTKGDIDENLEKIWEAIRG